MVRCLLTVLLKIHTDGLPPESKYHHTSQGFCNPEVKGKNKTRNKQKNNNKNKTKTKQKKNKGLCVKLHIYYPDTGQQSSKDLRFTEFIKRCIVTSYSYNISDLCKQWMNVTSQLFKRRENMNMLYILIPLLKRHSSNLVVDSLAQ